MIGEEELPTDKLYLDFGNHFEKSFWARAKTKPHHQRKPGPWLAPFEHSAREELDRLDEKVLDEHYRAH